MEHPGLGQILHCRLLSNNLVLSDMKPARVTVLKQLVKHKAPFTPLTFLKDTF